MSKVSLFRKWRSQSFSALVGQQSTVRTLKNILSEGTPARAYLFCGPRGTGKTSTARIFAKALCCERGPAAEPCDDCPTCRQITAGSCFDVMEIDAASNTQVDKIREFIIERVHFAPASARFKVYIIDEVHKLSSSSFNALLKTLEEPPSHVVFILATTHPHELPNTILSRCQKHEFRPFTIQETRQHLQHIAREEQLELADEAALYLARAAEGSMRDALVLLEQANNYCGTDLSSVKIVEMLGILPHQVLDQIAGWLQGQEVGPLLAELGRISQAGQDLTRFCGQLLDYFRQLMLLRVKAHDSSLDALPEHVLLSLRERAEQLQLGAILQWIKVMLETEEQLRRGAPALLVFEMSMVRLCGPEAPAGRAAEAPSGAAPPELATLRMQVQSLVTQVKALSEKVSSSVGAANVHSPASQAQPARPQTAPGSASPSQTQSPMEANSAPARSTPAPEPSAYSAAKTAPSATATASAPPEGTGAALESKPAPPAKAATEPPPTAALRSGQQPLAKNEKEFRNYLMQRLKEIKQMKLYGVLNDAKIDWKDSVITFGLPPSHSSFHFETINSAKGLLQQISQELVGSEVKVVCAIDEKHEKKNDTEQHEAMIRKASSLFAGKILEA